MPSPAELPNNSNRGSLFNSQLIASAINPVENPFKAAPSLQDWQVNFSPRTVISFGDGPAKMNPGLPANTHGLSRDERMAGVAGLEPVTSAVTGQRSNQLSYTPAKGNVKIKNIRADVKFCFAAFLEIF